ncbi:MAG: Flp pilus assembly complex ATPase component TadA, partial [Zoogloea sp.]|nr:Flp pilus assembly complex ATPase component TadA [Zoogloea sp.]
MEQPALPYSFARAHGVLVIELGAESATVLLREDADLASLAEVRRTLGVPLAAERAGRQAFESRLAELYSQGENSAAEVVADVGQEVDIEQLMTELPAVEDLLESQGEAPIIRMINALLTQAVRNGASDVHIEPYERHSVVRFRRDGVMHDVAQPHRALHAAMASRIKIMANLDIAEKRLPQDGRIALRLAGRQVDVRVSTLPTTHGERLVLRLLDKGSGMRGLASLGMAGETQEAFDALLGQPHGILLVTGP